MAPARGLAPLLEHWVAPLAMLLVAGCQPGPSITYGTAGAVASNSGSTGGGASGGSTSAGASSSGSTGAPNSPSPFVDGGYVFCALPSAPDAGPFGDGGPAAWLCQPGATFCDLGGDIGNCFQCRSDGDCANPSLPSYDPRRPYCDLRSGVPGYQGFCQQCLDNADCAGNPAGPLCDLNPDYPSGALVSNIELGGFEACGALITDCRLDGGPLCDGPNQVCDSDGGLCVTRLNNCRTDADCAGQLFFYLPIPYCLDGGYCSSCDGGLCADDGCLSSVDCGNPDNNHAGLICSDYKCTCVNSLACGGYWPICEGLNDFGVDGGLNLGLCGCDADWQCGDGGLRCMPSIANPYEGADGFCGVPCTSPLFPTCASLARDQPICESDSGLCFGCTSDADCQADAQTGGPLCLATGACGCAGDAGCRAGETCQPQRYDVDSCAVGLSQCVRGSCAQNGFCNWDSGSCAAPDSCLADSDCGSVMPFCDAGHCVQCRARSDCLKTGQAAIGRSFCSNGDCTDTCGSDRDCPGNVSGPVCVDHVDYSACGCGRDPDCAGNPTGPWCNTDAGHLFGYCGCRGDADCGPGQSCDVEDYTTFGQCIAGCISDLDCPSGTYCDHPMGSCRPRCDQGHICLGTDLFCDHGNVGLQNGEATWCYECLTGDDCGGTAGCTYELSCGPCADTSRCASDRVCVAGSCQPKCSQGACADGELCDALGVGGYGADVCLACITAADCSDGLGCNQLTHVCGTCWSPSQLSNPPAEGIDCPPGDVCSSYWIGGQTGVCFANCDLRSCPASQPLCEVVPSLTTDHRYCVACLHDSDCADAGPGAWCDVSVNFTFACQPAVP